MIVIYEKKMSTGKKKQQQRNYITQEVTMYM